MTLCNVCQGDAAERAIQGDFKAMETSCLLMEKLKKGEIFRGLRGKLREQLQCTVVTQNQSLSVPHQAEDSLNMYLWGKKPF